MRQARYVAIGDCFDGEDQYGCRTHQCALEAYRQWVDFSIRQQGGGLNPFAHRQ
jgi:hypothetical protein